jgi:hypothetical protein
MHLVCCLSETLSSVNANRVLLGVVEDREDPPCRDASCKSDTFTYDCAIFVGVEQLSLGDPRPGNFDWDHPDVVCPNLMAFELAVCLTL